MKKLLGIVVLGLLWCTSSFSHPDNKFVFLICEPIETVGEFHIQIDFKKRTIDVWDTHIQASEIYNIHDVKEIWIEARTKNKRIVIQRYLDAYRIQNLIEGKWKDDHDSPGICKTIKRKF